MFGGFEMSTVLKNKLLQVSLNWDLHFMWADPAKDTNELCLRKEIEKNLTEKVDKILADAENLLKYEFLKYKD